MWCYVYFILFFLFIFIIGRDIKKYILNYFLKMTDEEEYSDISPDLKNDIRLAFDIFKTKNETINKLKLRTILFSFIMYKNSAGDINKYIDENTNPEQEEYTFNDVCDLIDTKIQESKIREADEIFNYILRKTENTSLNVDDFAEAFKNYNIGVEKNEIQELMQFIVEDKKKNEDEDESDEYEEENNEGIPSKITRSQFKKFYIK